MMHSDDSFDLRSRYIDLLMKCILGMIYPVDPDYDESKRMEGLDWPASAHSMIGWKRMANVRQLVEAVINEDVPGDLIEAGVWRGGTCILMRGILLAYGIVDRTVYLADSFRGVPPPDVQRFPADAGMILHKFDYLTVPLDQVKENFRKYGLLDPQVMFVEGWFRDSLPKLAGSRFSLIRLDGDLYESTIEALDALYPCLSEGGFCIVDDYGVSPPCARAVEDYRGQHRITAPLQSIDASGRWWRKPRSR
jgi:hypothetical protein